VGKFQKGHIKKGGIKKGVKHQRSQQWAQLGESITSIHTERFNALLSQSDDDVFMDMYLKTLEYFKPKLQRSEVTQTTTIETQVFKIGGQTITF
jgi:hypothetical protein